MAFTLDLDEVSTLNFWRAVLAEFIASTVFLVAVSIGAYHGNVVSIGFTIGLAIATLAQCFGSVSGGHINPAVSFAMVIARKMSPIKGVAYMLAQCLGGVAGSAIAYWSVPSVGRSGMAVTDIAVGLTALQGFCIELVFTFLLVFTVFAVTDEKRGVEPYGTTLAIGLAIVVCHLAIIPLTGCGINPARSFGPAVVMNSWDNHWIYWAGPLSGGFVAAVLYELIFYVDMEVVHEINQSVELQQRMKQQTV